MGEIRISIPNDNLRFSYPVCKNMIFCSLFSEFSKVRNSEKKKQGV